MALIIGVVIVLLILFGFLCYKKAPPTEAIVVTGFGLARPKVVCGKGTFVLPVLQRADRLNMRLLKIDVKTPETGVKTQNGVSLWIDSVVTIQVYSENSTVLDEEVKASGLKDAKAYIMSRQQAAISNFLGMNEQGINDKVNDVLQGNLREIVSDMTVDQILTNRKQMALSVIENARPDLAKMGLEVVTFNVQDIRDAMEYMRGRSIRDRYMIIDEAQNMTPLQAFGIISRAGEGTKIILTGDPNQVDNPLLDSRTNGLTYAANAMKGSKVCTQITFAASECERSELAKEAIKRMQIKGKNHNK